MSHKKSELIAKLEKISFLHHKALSIKHKMANFVPEDNYERKSIVPVFPGEYEDEEDREDLECSVDHEDEDAIEQMTEEFDSRYCPREPGKPDFGRKPGLDTPLTNEYKKKKGWIPLVAGFVVVCSLISGGLFSGDALTIILNLVVIAACGVAVFFFFKRIKELTAADEEVTKASIAGYEQRNKEKEQKYEQDMKEYQSLMTSYKLSRADFIEAYTSWRNLYLESQNEEKQIAAKLEADRVAAVAKIEEEEFTPALQELAEISDIITPEYLPAIDIIIDLLKSGRADDFKEAINLYEDMVYRERQLQLQREQEERRRYEEEQRRRDEERRHQEEMKFREDQERRRRREEERRLRDEENRAREEARAREREALRMKYDEKERIRKEEYKKHMNNLEQERKQSNLAQAQCRACAHAGRCNMMAYNKTPTCTGFTPRR